jgi:predicted anti-sigma-YlaC factor YlaD
VAIEHLTDAQIQDYLDGNMSPDEQRHLCEHTDMCEGCRNNLLSYQQLYRNLKDDRDIVLSRMFTKNVLALAKKESMGEVHIKLTSVFLIFFGVIVALNTVMYYYDFGALFNHLKQSVDLNPDYFTDLNLNFEVNIYILTFAVFLLLAAVDYLFLRLRHRTF